MWNMIGRRQQAKVTAGGGVKSVETSVPSGPRAGLERGDTLLLAGVQANKANTKAQCGPSTPKHNYTPKQNHPLQVQQAAVTRN